MLSFPSQVFPQKRKDMTQLERYNMLIQISELVYLCKQLLSKCAVGNFSYFLYSRGKTFSPLLIKLLSSARGIL